MDKLKEFAQYSLERMKKSGAQHASCYILSEEQTEATFEQGDYSLLRTIETNQIQLKAVSDQKAGTAVAAALTREAIDSAVDQCMAKMKLAAPDPFEGIAEEAVSGSFTKGQAEANVSSMLRSMKEWEDAQSVKDGDSLNHLILSHHCKKEVYLNTNGVNLDSWLGYYGLGDESTNSFVPDLSKSIVGLGEVTNPYDESVKSRPILPLGSKFDGSIIFTPRFLRLYWYLALSIIFAPRDAVQSGREKHRWADQFGQAVASSCFSLSNRPMDPCVCNASPFTPEGFLARNADLVKDGVLQDLLYTGRTARMHPNKIPNIAPADPTSGFNLNIFIASGDTGIQRMIEGIDRGILLFSMRGAIPFNETGDFSGMSNDALLIESGQIVGPVKGVTIRGNFFEMQKNIRATSREFRLTGGDQTPWIAFDGLTIE